MHLQEYVPLTWAYSWYHKANTSMHTCSQNKATIPTLYGIFRQEKGTFDSIVKSTWMKKKNVEITLPFPFLLV